MRLTGEDRDVVLVGLVQGVVYDAVLVREAFEDVHAHLQACVGVYVCVYVCVFVLMCVFLCMRECMYACI